MMSNVFKLFCLQIFYYWVIPETIKAVSALSCCIVYILPVYVPFYYSFFIIFLFTSIIIQFLESVVPGGFDRKTNNLYTKTNQREITLDRRIIYTKSSQREFILFFTYETFIHCIIALMSSIIWSHYREFEHHRQCESP